MFTRSRSLRLVFAGVPRRCSRRATSVSPRLLSVYLDNSALAISPSRACFVFNFFPAGPLSLPGLFRFVQQRDPGKLLLPTLPAVRAHCTNILALKYRTQIALFYLCENTRGASCSRARVLRSVCFFLF